jgi:hypothetical protein
MNEVTTPQVSSNDTPQTRDTLLEQLNFLIDGARSNLMDMKASLAIDGPLLKPETTYTKEQVIKMLRDAYNLGATAHEENMNVRANSWSSGIEVRVEIEEGGFSFNGEVEVDADVIKEAVDFENHNMTDEQVDEILNS